MSVTPGAPRLTSLVMARTALELAVEAFADAVGGDAMGWAQDDAIADTLLSLVAVERRITALKGAVAARVSGGNAFAEAGFRNGASWVRSRTNESLASARRIFEHGEWMLAVPLMGAAWRQGLVSLAHVRTLVESHDRFPRVSAALTHCEPELVEIAKELDPATFSRVLLAKLCEIDPEAMDDAESKRRRRDVGLHVSATIDGFVVVNGLLPPEIGQQLINSLAAARDKARASAAEEFERRLSAVNVDALALILDAAASATGDVKLPDVGGARPVVQVTIDSESLIAHGASAPGWINSLTGQQITPVSTTSSFGNMVAAQLLTISLDSAAIITTRFTTAGGLCPETRTTDSPSPIHANASPTPTHQGKDHPDSLKDGEHPCVTQGIGFHAFQIKEFCDTDVV